MSPLLRRHLGSERRSSVRAHMGRRSSTENGIWALKGDLLTSERTARAANVRIEFLRCTSQASLQWASNEVARFTHVGARSRQ